MSVIGNQPGVSSQRTVLEEVVTGSPKSAFVPQFGYVKGYVDVLVNGHELDAADYTAEDGITVNLAVAAGVGDTVKVKAWIPRGLSDGYTKAEADARYVQLYNGKAGVGTTTPAKLFVVSNNGANGIEIQPDDASTSGLNRMLSYNRTSGAYTPMVFQGSEYRIYTKGASADEVVRVDNAGVVQLLQGQLKFPASQNASSDANTLDDYEEGTFTPTVNLLGTLTYNQQYGRYTKVGRLVTVSIDIGVSSTDTTQDNSVLFVGGLPFSCTVNNGAGSTAIMNERMKGTNSATAPNTFFVRPEVSTTTLRAYANNYNGSIGNASYYASCLRNTYSSAGYMYMNFTTQYETS